MIKKEITISNLIWILGLIFSLGVAYSSINQLEEDIKVLDSRLDKKIKIINENEDRIVELEKRLPLLLIANITNNMKNLICNLLNFLTFGKVCLKMCKNCKL